MTSWKLKIFTAAVLTISINIGSADKTAKELVVTTEHHTNTRPAATEIRGVMDTSTHFFHDIRNMPAYVDKSLLVKAVLENEVTSMLITAPRRSGKSTNLSMMKRFFEILPDEAEQRANRELFNGLQIEKEENIMNEHCGKHPVIFLDYICGKSLENVKEVYGFLRGVVQKAYKEHRYLANSSKLTDIERKRVMKYCDFDFETDKVPPSLASSKALEYLAEYLVQHYGRKVIVLVDEYDSVATNAMQGDTNKEELKEIIQSSIADFSVLAKGNIHVSRVIMTGISYIATMGLSHLNNVKVYKFQEESCFSQYYGLTKEECKELLTRFNLESQYDEIIRYYDGYRGNILSIWSIMHYLDTKKITNYWSQSGTAYNLDAALRYELIRSCITKLLNKANSGIIEINIIRKFTFTDIYKLKNMFEQTHPFEITPVEKDIFFTFLLEQGYLAIVEVDKERTTMKIKIPNHEIRLEFTHRLRVFYEGVFHMNRDAVFECASKVDKISASDDVQNEKILKEIHLLLNDIIPHMVIPNKNDATLHDIVFLIFYFSDNFHCFSQITAFPEENNNKRLNIFLLSEIKKIAIIMELKFKHSSTIALQQILQKNYIDTLRNRRYLNYTIDYYILIGLSADQHYHTTMSVLFNNDDFSKKVDIL